MKVNQITTFYLLRQKGVVPSGISRGGRRFSCPLPFAPTIMHTNSSTKSEATKGEGYSLNSIRHEPIEPNQLGELSLTETIADQLNITLEDLVIRSRNTQLFLEAGLNPLNYTDGHMTEIVDRFANKLANDWNGLTQYTEEEIFYELAYRLGNSPEI